LKKEPSVVKKETRPALGTGKGESSSMKKKVGKGGGGDRAPVKLKPAQSTCTSLRDPKRKRLELWNETGKKKGAERK